MKTIIEITKDVNRTYAILNQWISQHHLADKVVPNHDGDPDYEVIAALIQLRSDLQSLQRAAQVAIDNISANIDMYDNI